MEIYITRVVETLILPPGALILLMVLGALVLRRFYRTGSLMMLTGFFLLIATSLPITAQAILYLTESVPPIAKIDIENPEAGAIVVLGSGRDLNAPEYGTEVVSDKGLARLRYAALLHKQTRLPLLLSGGAPLGATGSEASLMQQALGISFNISAKWLEHESHNTWQNAVNSKVILEQEGISHIILVTHAVHMPRAITAFKAQDLKVTPAPTGFSTQPGQTPWGLSLLPSAQAMQDIRTALHELVGQLWYRLRYQSNKKITTGSTGHTGNEFFSTTTPSPAS
jgi:uncharacterized SAM-binding protein YcdF (DUF218 family)